MPPKGKKRARGGENSTENTAVGTPNTEDDPAQHDPSEGAVDNATALSLTQGVDSLYDGNNRLFAEARNILPNCEKFSTVADQFLRIEELAEKAREMRSSVLAILETQSESYKRRLVRLNVGGELFEVCLSTLLAQDAPNYFHSLFCEPTLLRDYDAKTESIFIDRDPVTFRFIINYLRGYSYFQALSEEERTKLKVDAEYYCLEGLHHMLSVDAYDKTSTRTETGYFMKDAPGVSVDRKRFRVVYCVSTIGDVYFVAGKHTITFQIVRADYVGIGLVSDSCINRDQEYHKTANCCVYYMSGVFYTNFPHHRKEENLEKISDGDLVTLTVDMDKGMAEYKLKSSTKMFSIGRIARLKFSVIMKFMSQVRIVSEPAVKQ